MRQILYLHNFLQQADKLVMCAVRENADGYVVFGQNCRVHLYVQCYRKHVAVCGDDDLRLIVLVLRYLGAGPPERSGI